MLALSNIIRARRHFNSLFLACAICTVVIPGLPWQASDKVKMHSRSERDSVHSRRSLGRQECHEGTDEVSAQMDSLA